VKPLKRSRAASKGGPGESPAQIYRRHLELPPWPVPWLLSVFFRHEQRAAMNGRLKTGTSLFAVARKPAG
jgi:hypothetical protein